MWWNSCWQNSAVTTFNCTKSWFNKSSVAIIELAKGTWLKIFWVASGLLTTTHHSKSALCKKLKFQNVYLQNAWFKNQVAKTLSSKLTFKNSIFQKASFKKFIFQKTTAGVRTSAPFLLAPTPPINTYEISLRSSFPSSCFSWCHPNAIYAQCILIQLDVLNICIPSLWMQSLKFDTFMHPCTQAPHEIEVTTARWQQVIIGFGCWRFGTLSVTDFCSACCNTLTAQSQQVGSPEVRCWSSHHWNLVMASIVDFW